MTAASPGRSPLRQWAQALKRYTLTVYFAARDPRTPRLIRLLALLVAAYALSPIDLIPDFIPVLGYLDDLLLVPLGLMLVVKYLPAAVMQDAQARALAASEQPVGRGMGAFIATIWISAALGLGWWAFRAARA